jgi:hypothetical protein
MGVDYRILLRNQGIILGEGRLIEEELAADERE